MPYAKIRLTKYGKPSSKRLVIPAHVIKELTKRHKSFTLFIGRRRINWVRTDRRIEIPSETRRALNLKPNVAYTFAVRPGPGLFKQRKWFKIGPGYPQQYHRGFDRSLKFDELEGYDFDYCWNEIKKFVIASFRKTRATGARLVYVKIYFLIQDTEIGADLVSIITSWTYAALPPNLENLLADLQIKYERTLATFERAHYVIDWRCIGAKFFAFSEYRYGKRAFKRF